MGHNAHREIFLKINKHMIITMLIKRRKNSLFTLWELNGFSFEQTWIPFTQGCTVAGLVEIGWNLSSGSWEDFLLLSMYFWYFVIFPWIRAGLFIWTNLNPFHSRILCANFGWNWSSSFWEELFLSMYFRYLVIISPWKRVGPFIWTNLNSLHPRMLCAKFGWNWAKGSGEEDENGKSLIYDDNNNVDGFDQKSSLELSVQVS